MISYFCTFCVCFRPIQLYLEHLSPLFHVDCLLPRTLLSIMSLEHIDQVYMSMVVPPDACLANAFFFVNTGYYVMEEMVFIYWIQDYSATYWMTLKYILWLFIAVQSHILVLMSKTETKASYCSYFIMSSSTDASCGQINTNKFPMVLKMNNGKSCGLTGLVSSGHWQISWFSFCLPNFFLIPYIPY